MASVLTHLLRLKEDCWDALSSRFAGWTRPLGTSLPLATLTDLGKSKSQLIAENALLRQQLIMLKRQVKRPACTKTDRVLLVLLTRWVRTWQQALLIVQPDTLLRGPRELFRFIWKRKETQVKGRLSQAEDCGGNHHLNPGDDKEKSTLGC